MPLRSVEAATRDDAIAAAREQFGPATRVVGVRRVRSGGVLGFFATERYVAEVAPDPIGAPVGLAPAPAQPVGALTEDPDTGSLAAFGSPLASAGPARARTAPPRNGAAAWAAEAARAGAPARRAAPALVGAVSTSGHRVDVPRLEPADDARVEELASLLGKVTAPSPPPNAPAVPNLASRAGVALATFPRATRESRAPAPVTDRASAAAGPTAPTTDAPTTGAPSPFTAALARMVAGDRDVQHAVRAALETSDAAQADDETNGAGASRVESEATSQSAVWSLATHQEEETAGDHVIAPASTPVDERPEFAAWTDELTFSDESFFDEPAIVETAIDEPLAATPSPVSREKAIAEVLRTALAEGHSDDALAGILRKVVAGDSPQSALAEPPETADVVVDAPTTPAAVELPDVDLPHVEPSVAEVAVRTDVEPVVGPLVLAPVRFQFDPLSSSAAPPTVTAGVAPEAVPASSLHLWGEATSTPVLTTRSAEPARPSDFRIRGEVPPAEPMPAAETPVFETPLFEAPVPEELQFELQHLQTATPEALETESSTTEATETEEAVSVALHLELAPLLARTASDATPLTRSMAMDATTVMPPLSLLPGSPSRGRGLPPVPPRTGRPSVPPSKSTTAPSTALPPAAARSPLERPSC